MVMPIQIPSHTHPHIYAKIIVQFNSGHSQRRRFSWRPIRWAVIKRFVMPVRVREASVCVCGCVCVRASDNKAVYVLILLAWKPCSNYARQQTQQQNREKATYNKQKIYTSGLRIHVNVIHADVTDSYSLLAWIRVLTCWLSRRGWRLYGQSKIICSFAPQIDGKHPTEHQFSARFFDYLRNRKVAPDLLAIINYECVEERASAI